MKLKSNLSNFSKTFYSYTLMKYKGNII